MIRKFEELSIKVGSTDIGRFAGEVEFEVYATGATVICIKVKDETNPRGAPLVLKPYGTGRNGMFSAFIFDRLQSALLARFADDLLKITKAAQQREPAPLRSAVRGGNWHLHPVE